MIYACQNRDCGFLFERHSEPECCPDCGKMFIRPATPEEAAEYKRRISGYLKSEAVHGGTWNDHN